mmetsp:Transcript_31275/g.105239  ORF Transcript_31275/g.105239 Transcript_31275/m.105239 type:complete len:236 (-) Transcript_31275:720-1427(-)
MKSGRTPAASASASRSSSVETLDGMRWLNSMASSLALSRAAPSFFGCAVRKTERGSEARGVSTKVAAHRKAARASTVESCSRVAIWLCSAFSTCAATSRSAGVAPVDSTAKRHAVSITCLCAKRKESKSLCKACPTSKVLSQTSLSMAAWACLRVNVTPASCACLMPWTRVTQSTMGKDGETSESKTTSTSLPAAASFSDAAASEASTMETRISSLEDLAPVTGSWQTHISQSMA